MNKIDRADYPKNLDWEDKVFSMPNIPRGDGGLISVLREVLTQVANNTWLILMLQKNFRLILLMMRLQEKQN